MAGFCAVGNGRRGGCNLAVEVAAAATVPVVAAVPQEVRSVSGPAACPRDDHIAPAVRAYCLTATARGAYVNQPR